MLYAWESRGGSEETLVPVYSELAESLRISPRNRLYTEVLVRLVARKAGELDILIQRNLTNWNLSRLSAIDRNILRLGVAEILYVDDVPPKVSIREAIRLAETYGTEESPRFINGVLDAVMRDAEIGGAAGAR